MKSRFSIWMFVLALSVVIISGCGTTTVDPTENPLVPPTEVPVDTPTQVPTPIPTPVPTDTPTDVVEQVSEWVLDARDAALVYVAEQYGEAAPVPDLSWTGGFSLSQDPPPGWSEYEFTSGDWVVTIGHAVLPPEQTIYQIAVTNQAAGFQWEGEVDAAGQVTEILSPVTEQLALCWYGRIESTPPGGGIDRYLILLPEEARRAVDLVGADETVEAEIEALRDSGTYAHFWGTLDCDAPRWGSCQLIVDRLRAEGPEGPFFDPDPVAGWTGSLLSTPDGAQFDDYFVRSGSIPMGYGIGSADAAVAAQLESLRDAPAIVRVWGQVECPAIDFQGSHIQVERVEVIMEASAQAGYEDWKPYTSAEFGYALWYPGECTVMGDLNESVTFSGPLVGNDYWPILTVSHYDSDFYHPPAGVDLVLWITDHVLSYDAIDIEIEIAGLPAVHLRHEGGQGGRGSDDYYFIRGEQLFKITILDAGELEDWELYDKFLQGITFP
jgi:hypothetical protein